MYPLQQRTFCTAADLSEPSAIYLPIQRHQPNHPPHKIVDSAALRERLASHFSGCIAQNAICINK
jgi:hypothetical protein